LAEFTFPSRDGVPPRPSISCSFSLKSLLQLNSSIPASNDVEVVLHRRDFRRLAITSLILSKLARLFHSNIVREAAEEMHWNAVMSAENAISLAPQNPWPPSTISFG